ncbi:hypothetical protein I3842_06G073300 [Carya illinoinensis]|uniref:Uncharacterized protein n=1 Tax=Carya illinoinensis TaxID=32201 RepID=A0A922ERP0_CARIL|nr:hypothetical protein I3842_06G073300 [Carya illinoinensis]
MPPSRFFYWIFSKMKASIFNQDSWSEFLPLAQKSVLKVNIHCDGCK